GPGGAGGAARRGPGRSGPDRRSCRTPRGSAWPRPPGRYLFRFPFMVAHEYPPEKWGNMRLEPPRVGHVDHGAAVGGLGRRLCVVVDAVVAGDDAVAVGPDQGDEVDPLDDLLVLARPVAADEVDVSGVGLVQHGVVQHQDPLLEADLGPGLQPEGLGVRL